MKRYRIRRGPPSGERHPNAKLTDREREVIEALDGIGWSGSRVRRMLGLEDRVTPEAIYMVWARKREREERGR